MEKTIYLQKIGQVDPIILKQLKKTLKWTFKKYFDTINILKNPLPLLESYYNSSRKQYKASSILIQLIDSIKNKNEYSTLGILDKDLYSKTYSFVFGVALEFNRVALISTTRLKESFYGRAENISLFELRIAKEAIHELGHTFGLKHCHKECVMQFSNSLAKVDMKPAKFCQTCSEKLKDLLENLA